MNACTNDESGGTTIDAVDCNTIMRTRFNINALMMRLDLVSLHNNFLRSNLYMEIFAKTYSNVITIQQNVIRIEKY